MIRACNQIEGNIQTLVMEECQRALQINIPYENIVFSRKAFRLSDSDDTVTFSFENVKIGNVHAKTEDESLIACEKLISEIEKKIELSTFFHSIKITLGKEPINERPPYMPSKGKGYGWDVLFNITGEVVFEKPLKRINPELFQRLVKIIKTADKYFWAHLILNEDYSNGEVYFPEELADEIEQWLGTLPAKEDK